MASSWNGSVRSIHSTWLRFIIVSDVAVGMSQESGANGADSATDATQRNGTEPAPAFDEVSEIILYVEDMERLVSFYTETLGLEIIAGKPEHGFVELDTGTCSLCLHAGDGEAGPGAPKFVFAVEDVETVRASLQSRDVEVGEIRSPVPGTQVCDGVDPEGNKFSIESS